MRPASATARPVLVGLAALALTSAGLIAASPAAGDTLPPPPPPFTAPYTEWTVPDGVSWIWFEVAGGPGGAGGGPYAGYTDRSFIVTGKFRIEAGRDMQIWVGQPGGDGRADGVGGAGGAGYQPGGDGGDGGVETGGGGGGGGASALKFTDHSIPILIVGGGGGGGGSLNDGSPRCDAGAGGVTTFPGAAANGPECDTSVTPQGGAAGIDHSSPGVDAADVADPEVNRLQSGAGGGGGGGGQPGETLDGTNVTTGAGGGGGGYYVADFASAYLQDTRTTGYVTIRFEPPEDEAPAPEDPTLPATGPSTSTTGWLAGGLVVFGIGAAIAAVALRRRAT